jgi:hypothetical protein
VVLIQVFAVASGLFMIVLALIYVRLIKRAKPVGGWAANTNVRLFMASRVVGWLLVGTLFVIGGVLGRGWPLIGAAAVLAVASALGWWLKRRNGGPISTRPTLT